MVVFKVRLNKCSNSPNNPQATYWLMVVGQDLQLGLLEAGMSLLGREKELSSVLSKILPSSNHTWTLPPWDPGMVMSASWLKLENVSVRPGSFYEKNIQSLSCESVLRKWDVSSKIHWYSLRGSPGDQVKVVILALITCWWYRHWHWRIWPGPTPPLGPPSHHSNLNK